MLFCQSSFLFLLSTTSVFAAELRGSTTKRQLVEGRRQSCRNTAPYAGMDEGCDPIHPICLNEVGYEIPFMTYGYMCAPCRNTQRGILGDRLPDEGCPDGKPRCLLLDGSEPAHYSAGEMCGGGIGCVNTAPYGGQDTNCPSNEPICVDSLGREPPFHVGGASCVPCVNTQPGVSRLLPDQGCFAEEPFCINLDNSAPQLHQAGQTCSATHPSELSKVTPSPTSAPTITPTAPPTQALVQDVDIEYDDGLPCDPSDIGLTFNPPNGEYPQMIDNGEGACILRMTPDSGPMFAASAFTSHTFEPSNTKRAFSMSLGYRVFGPSYGSADGMAFVMHQDPRGVNALGGVGGQMGVYERDGAKGIYPALVIEFDTYSNWELLDNGENNIHITIVDEKGTIHEVAETTGIDIRTDENGSTAGKLWVDYCDDKTIRVFINNKGDAKPETELLSASADLESLFQGQSVSLGYTAAIGGQKDFQDITSWSFKEQCPI